MSSFAGVGGVQVCSIKENNFQLPDSLLESIKSASMAAFNITPPPKPDETISHSKYAIKLDNDLVKKYEDRIVAKNRRERILPPIKLHTCTFTLGLLEFLIGISIYFIFKNPLQI